MMCKTAGGQVGRWAGVVAVLLAIGCDGPADRPTGPLAATDSAGITIVTNTAPQWSADSGWKVGDRATLAITSVPGVAAAVRLSDGRIVIGTTQLPGLHYFAPDGRLLYTVGGQDEVTEIYRAPTYLTVGRGDTVGAFDLARGLALVLDANGALVRSTEVKRSLTPAGSNGFLPKGMAPDGRYLLQRDEVDYPFTGPPGSVIADSTKLFWLSSDGRFTDSTAPLVAGEVFGFSAEVRPGEHETIPLSRPIGPILKVASGMAGTWIGEGRRWELQRLGATGKVERIVRLPIPLAPFTPALRDTFVAHFRASWARAARGTLQQQFGARLDEAPFPDTLPAFTDLILGADSTLWVQRAGALEGLMGQGAGTWTVLDPEGRWLGEVTMPADFRLLAAGRGWILGVATGADRRQAVRLYPLVER